MIEYIEAFDNSGAIIYKSTIDLLNIAKIPSGELLQKR